MFDTETRQYL